MMRKQNLWPAVASWIFVLIITWVIYKAPPGSPLNAFRYLYFIPIILVSILYGLAPGLFGAFLVASFMLPNVLKAATEGFFSEHLLSLLAEILLLVLSPVAVDQWLGSQRRQRDFYKALSDLGELLASQKESDALLKTLLESLVQLTGSTWGEIVMKENGSLIRKAFWGEPTSRKLHRPLPQGVHKTLADLVIQEGKSVVSANLELDPRFFRWVDTPVTFSSFIAIPLRLQGEPVGLVALANKPEGLYTSQEIRMIKAVVSKGEIALENLKLLEREKRRAAKLAALNEIARVVSSVMNLRLLFTLVHNEISRLMKAENFYIALYDPETETVEFAFVVEEGQIKEGAKRKVIPGRGLTEYIIFSGKPLLLSADAEEKLKGLGVEPEGEGPFARSWLGVPLIAGDRVTGAMVVHSYEGENLYSQDDLEVLQNIAYQTAIAIENARLLERTDKALAQKVKELTILSELDREMALASSDLDRLLKLVVEKAVAYTGADAGLLALVEEKNGGRGLYLKSSVGYPPIIEQYINNPYPLERGITGRVVRTGQAVLCPDVREDPDYDPVRESTLSQLTVPIFLEGKILGAITLESSHLNAFTREDLNFISSLADRAAIAINQARLFEEVRRASEAKSAFIGDISHELRNPLTSIKGYTDLILAGKSGPLSERQEELLRKVRSNAERMEKLLRDLSELSKIEAGKIPMDITSVNLKELIAELVDSCWEKAADKGLTVHMEVDDDLPPVKADRLRVTEILSNLMDNACAYTPQGGKITVRAFREDKFVRVEVEDTGIGIPPEEQPKIFGRFFRGSHPMVRERQGTGLGLHIAKKLVEMQGGTIWFKSFPGKGSTFIFTLPVWE
ncbi:MAG: GAF domain-containing protein [Anaerolineae bacterium]|nr:GAF domain-containing protein [Anaerolineae bacterium]MDW8102509.1 GAF domain-containing protein [Anaerolineae bacterium]